MHRKSYGTSPGMGIGGIGISKMLGFMSMFFWGYWQGADRWAILYADRSYIAQPS